MKFAKIVFIAAAIWGFIITVPLYFLFDSVGRQSPPAINHPEFYYAFAGVTLTWQFAFLLIGQDPRRFRIMMVPAILEKLSYVIAISALFLQSRISVAQAAPAISDSVLAVCFTVAFVKTRGMGEQSGLL